MKRPYFLLCLGLLLVALPAFAAPPPPPKPNIIFIMADDYPWPFYGFMKAIEDTGTFEHPTQHPDFPAIETPNMDRLASRGAVFPVGASADSVCVPSFSATLQGVYTTEVKSGRKNMPEYLAEEGYISYGYGKVWAAGYGPLGFTEPSDKFKRNGHDLTKIFEFLDSRSPGGPPWMVWYSPHLPHSPYNVSRPFLPLFDGVEFPRSSRKGAMVFANITLLDQAIGELLDGLASRGLDQNTMIVYQSDNGHLLPNSKRRLGENGFRTPIMVSLPSRIPPNLVMPQMVHAVDLIPTMVDYAGGTVDPDELSGQSLRPLLESPSTPGREFLITNKGAPQRFMLRTQDGLRLHQRAPGVYELFDLLFDPDETNDLIDNPAYNVDLPIWIDAIEEWRANLKD